MYISARPSIEPPRLLDESPAGQFKGNPTVPVSEPGALWGSRCTQDRPELPRFVGLGSVRSGFGDGDTCCFLVDDGVIGGEGGGQRMQSEVVDRAGVTAGGVVDQPDRVPGEQGVGPSGDFAMMPYVVGGVGGAIPAIA